MNLNTFFTNNSENLFCFIGIFMRFNSTNSSSGLLGPDNLTSLPSNWKQAMIGLLLGDGTLVKKYKGGGTYFKFAQGEIHSSYFYMYLSFFQKPVYVIWLNQLKVLWSILKRG